MKFIKKRNGSLQEWNPEKIEAAIKKAFSAVQNDLPDDYTLNKIVLNVIAELGNKSEDGVIDIESVQDSVEKVLTESGFYAVGKAYVLYRQTRKTIREVKDNLPATDIVNGYISKGDWRVKENSTINFSLGGFILSNSGAITSSYWLNEIYPSAISDMHRNCTIHIHDLSMLSAYCAGWNLKDLIKIGIESPNGKISSAPASHLSTLCNQMVNFLGIMQNEWAGAQAFSSFDTYLAPFVKTDNLTYHQVKQCIQSFVFGVNTPSRWGSQAPFTNITIDWSVPKDLKDLPAIVGGKEMDFTYGDCQHEMDMVNKAFLEVMNEGDSKGRGFQYPIPTYSITKDFDWAETENNKLLFEMTAKYGTPYFSNYVNSDMDPSDIRSMCCRLRLDLRELRRKNGGFFGSGENTGSVGVVTINLPHLAYLSEDEGDFWKRLDKVMDLCAESLHIKREFITKLLDNDFFPYTKIYLHEGFRNHFSTIGVCGGNEMCLNAKWLKKDLRDEESQEFCKKVLSHMRERLSDYQEKYAPELYNLEATPAESTSYRFAKHDKENFPDIITANDNGTPYYTNSTNLPVGATSDVFTALDVQDELQTLYTSGTVFHTFLGEKLPDWKSAANLVKKITENYRLPYISISPTYSVCPDHGYIAGEHFTCPLCGRESEVYSRITGYYRPVKNWNDGKAQEFKDRITYVPDINKNIKPVHGADCENGSHHLEDSEPTKSAKLDGSLPILFKTSTCPNCKAAVLKLDMAGIQYNVVNCTEDEETPKAYGISQAPTLLVDGEKIQGVGPILKWIKEVKE